ncbi:hypothetical protein QVD17_16453 [Tagetes erecta]|uniref:Uncharacterized protein n=1 Tax=Tagetes erecta TaxID=13708 RepID=A0AAD8P0P4_TARER|nr:hypothetical protein QVD17_16453 [Tagetes erecta]
MDSYEATRVVFTRIQALDPEYASKIMGLLLIQDHGEKEMIRLAFGPESLIQSVIIKARNELGVSSPSTPSSPSSFTSHTLSRQNSSRLVTNIPSPLSIPSLSSCWSTSDEPDLIDELQIQDHLSFLNDHPGDFIYPDLVSPNSSGGDMFASPHRRSSSVNDVCLYFARGYCKNGATCRFNHGGGEAADMAALPVDMMDQCHELLRSKSAQQQRLLMANFPFPNSPRMAAAALMMGEDVNKFGRSRNDFSIGMLNPGSRQIYLTFPADSTFREEDVSNYFSMYGPVQDVRIPYQQKRMFGFVTFVYAETVKLILAKGNPHFVCDARVLVKPYKEKGKVPDKFRKQPNDSPTGFDSRDPFDLQLGARMLYNGQDLLWRKKLEEQADLQHAIELQNRRIMDLQLLDVKRSHHQRALSTGAAIPSPTCYSPSYLNHSVFASDSRSSSSPDSEDGLISKMATRAIINGDEPLETNLNMEKEKETLEHKDETNNGKSSPREDEEGDINLPESLEHNLPDNLFASPKASGDCQTVFSNNDNTPVSFLGFLRVMVPSECSSYLVLFSFLTLGRR